MPEDKRVTSVGDQRITDVGDDRVALGEGRTISDQFLSEIIANVIRPIFLAEFEFDSAPIYFWNGVGSLVHDGKTYTGAGNLGSVDTVQETQEVKAAVTRFRLAGVSSSIIGTALTESYQNRPCKLRVGFRNLDGTVVTDPYLQYEGVMDVMVHKDNGTTADITLTTESEIRRLEPPNERRLTKEDQALDNANDSFFDYVESIQDKILISPAR